MYTSSHSAPAQLLSRAVTLTRRLRRHVPAFYSDWSLSRYCYQSLESMQGEMTLLKFTQWPDHRLALLVDEFWEKPLDPLLTDFRQLEELLASLIMFFPYKPLVVSRRSLIDRLSFVVPKIPLAPQAMLQPDWNDWLAFTDLTRRLAKSLATHAATKTKRQCSYWMEILEKVAAVEFAGPPVSPYRPIFHFADPRGYEYRHAALFEQVRRAYRVCPRGDWANCQQPTASLLQGLLVQFVQLVGSKEPGHDPVSMALALANAPQATTEEPAKTPRSPKVPPNRSPFLVDALTAKSTQTRTMVSPSKAVAALKAAAVSKPPSPSDPPVPPKPVVAPEPTAVPKPVAAPKPAKSPKPASTPQPKPSDPRADRMTIKRKSLWSDD